MDLILSSCLDMSLLHFLHARSSRLKYYICIAPEQNRGNLISTWILLLAEERCTAFYRVY